MFANRAPDEIWSLLPHGALGVGHVWLSERVGAGRIPYTGGTAIYFHETAMEKFPFVWSFDFLFLLYTWITVSDLHQK
jgi:hypothetical protein